MERLAHRVSKEREKNRRFAQLGCQLIDVFLYLKEPDALQEVQEGLLLGLLEVEAQIKWANTRGKKRRERWLRLKGRSPAEWDRRAAHLSCWRGMVSILVERRDVLRQCGDALAWLLLHNSPRSFEALFSRTRNHHITDDIGLCGVRTLIAQGHASKRFFLLNADLTRCLGKGDILAVPYGQQWCRPLVYEVKTHQTGGEVEIELLGHRIHHPLDDRAHAEFHEVLGFRDGGTRALSARAERQMAELKEASDTLVELTHNIRPNVPPPARKWWVRLRTVLFKAQQYGIAYDSPESDLAYFAFRQDQLLHNSSEGMLAKQRVISEGLITEDPSLAWLSTLQLGQSDAFSKAVPPVALWDLPQPMRAAILSGEIVLVTIWKSSVWRSAFRRWGVTLRDVHGAWQLSRGTQQAHLDLIEVRSVLGAVAFAGVSPSDVVTNIVKSLSDSSEEG